MVAASRTSTTKLAPRMHRSRTSSGWALWRGRAISVMQPSSGEPASCRADDTAHGEQTDTAQWFALRLGGNSAGGMPSGRLRRLLSDGAANLGHGSLLSAVPTLSTPRRRDQRCRPHCAGTPVQGQPCRRPVQRGSLPLPPAGTLEQKYVGDTIGRARLMLLHGSSTAV